MICVLLILVLVGAIAELTIALTYNHKISEYVALVSQIEEAEKRLKDIDRVVPAYLTATDLERTADYTSLAFDAQLYDIAGNDPQRDDIIKAQYYAVNTFRLLAAERRGKETHGAIGFGKSSE